MLGVVTYDEDDPADDYLREYAEEIGVGGTYAKTRVGVFLGEPGETVRGPVLRRRRAGPHRLPALRALHGRLPARRQEHAGQELPVVRGARGRAGDAGAHRGRHPPARRGRRLGGLRGHDRALGRVVARATGGRRRRKGVVVAAGALGTNRLLAACRLNGSLPKLSPRLGELVRTNSEAILAVTLPEGAPDVHAPGGDHRLDLPRPGDPHRDRRLRRGRRRRVRAVHAADRRRARRSRGR